MSDSGQTLAAESDAMSTGLDNTDFSTPLARQGQRKRSATSSGLARTLFQNSEKGATKASHGREKPPLSPGPQTPATKVSRARRDLGDTPMQHHTRHSGQTHTQKLASLEAERAELETEEEDEENEEEDTGEDKSVNEEDTEEDKSGGEEGSCTTADRLPSYAAATLASEVPLEFRCPITRKIMSDPVVLPSGHSFERNAIMDWLSKGYNVCPTSRAPLDPSAALVPNLNLRDSIKRWEKFAREHFQENNDVSGPWPAPGQSRSISYAGTYDYHMSDSTACPVGAAGLQERPSALQEEKQEQDTEGASASKNITICSDLAHNGAGEVGVPERVKVKQTAQLFELRAAQLKAKTPPPRRAGGAKPHMVSPMRSSSYHEYFSSKRASLRTYVAHEQDVETRWSSQIHMVQPGRKLGAQPHFMHVLSLQSSKGDRAVLEAIPALLAQAASSLLFQKRLDAVKTLARICRPPGCFGRLPGISSLFDQKWDATHEHMWSMRGDFLTAAGGIPVLVNLLDDVNSDDIRLGAAQAVAAAAASSEIPCAAAQLAGAPLKLVEVLATSANPELLEACAWALLSVTSSSDSNLMSIVELGVIPMLLSLLELATKKLGDSSWEGTAAACCWILHGLTIAGTEMGIVVGSEAGIEPVSILLMGKERELRLAAVVLMSCLLESSDGNAVRCVRAGALSGTLSMVADTGDQTLSDMAACCLSGMISGEGGRLHAISASGVTMMLNMLYIAPTSIAGWRCLADLLEDPQGCKQLLTTPWAAQFLLSESHGIAYRRISEDFTEASKMPTDTAVERCSAIVRCIRLLSSAEERRRLVMDVKVVAMLVRLLDNSWRHCMEQAAGTLYNISESDEGRALIASCLNSIGLLLQAAQVGSQQGREWAASTLQSLCYSDKQLDKLWSVGGASSLLSIIQGKMSQSLVETSARILYSLVDQVGERRREISGLGTAAVLRDAILAFPEIQTLLKSTYAQCSVGVSSI